MIITIAITAAFILFPLSFLEWIDTQGRDE
jgi:hypothetical protein